MKGFKKQKDDSNMNIHRGILGCVFVGCEGPCRDGSCNPCVCSHGNGSIWGVQWMEEVAHGRPRYLRSWENIPRDCVQERRSGIDRWIQRTSLNSSVNAGPRRFPEHPREAFASKPGFAAGWVSAFWPTMDVEPYQFPKKPHKSQVHHTAQISQITSIWLIKPLPSSIDGMIQCTIAAV